jgi:folate-binding protein YgfZ
MHVEPGSGPELIKFLDSMRFMLRVEVEDLTGSYAVVTVPTGSTDRPGVARLSGSIGDDLLVPRETLGDLPGELGQPVGIWAYEALRIAAHIPRAGFETDHRAIPHEVGWIGTAVHLDKGCYRGQETVARVHNVGHPPRRLVLLHLDGSVEVLPERGAGVTLEGDLVGSVTSSARHYELGPIALALVKRLVPVDATLLAGGVPGAQEVIVSPDAGLGLGGRLREEFRPRRSLL